MIGLVLAATLAAAPPATVGVITNPDWVQIPDAEQIGYAYPKPAQWVGVTGRAVVDCNVTELGRLNRCRVEAEHPAGLGFGAAGLKMTPYFQMSPKRVDGRPIAGGQVRVPIRFTLSEASASPPPTLGRSPSPEDSALARRLAVASGASAVLKENFDSQVQQMSRHYGNLSEEPGGAAAIEAWKTALSRENSTFIDLVAASYAQTFTAAEMKPILAFYESPAGRMLVQRQPAMAQAFAASSPGLTEVMQKAAREAFCRSRDCTVPPLTSAPTKQ